MLSLVICFLVCVVDKFLDESGCWPEGTYGLPKPISGCPRDAILWENGWRYHDTENNLNENGFSKNLHIDGSVTEEGILHKFCMKTYSAGSYK